MGGSATRGSLSMGRGGVATRGAAGAAAEDGGRGASAALSALLSVSTPSGAITGLDALRTGPTAAAVPVPAAAVGGIVGLLAALLAAGGTGCDGGAAFMILVKTESALFFPSFFRRAATRKYVAALKSCLEAWMLAVTCKKPMGKQQERKGKRE